MKKEFISRVLTTKGVKNFLQSTKLGKGAGYEKYMTKKCNLKGNV